MGKILDLKHKRKCVIGLILLLLIVVIICLIVSHLTSNSNGILDKKDNLNTTKYQYSNIITYLQLNSLPDEYYGYFYKNELITQSDIPNKIKLYMAIRKVISDNSENLTSDIEIKASDVGDALKVIFGSNVSYTHESITVNDSDYVLFEYDRNKSIYKQTESDYWASISRNTSIISEIVDTIDTDDTIVVSEKVGFVSTSYDLDSKKVIYYIYKDINNTELVATVDAYNIDSCRDKLSTYRYTFKKENNNYYIEKVELVK